MFFVFWFFSVLGIEHRLHANTNAILGLVYLLNFFGQGLANSLSCPAWAQTHDPPPQSLSGLGTQACTTLPA